MVPAPFVNLIATKNTQGRSEKLVDDPGSCYTSFLRGIENIPLAILDMR